MFAVFHTCYCISRTSNGISKKEMLLQQMSACADNSGSLALLRLKNTRGGELILIDLLKITLLHIYIYIYIYIIIITTIVMVITFLYTQSI